ncbi:hypothetical protein Tco_0759413 [Tanacetum coccineum]
MKRVAKTIEFMDAIAEINDPQCELLLLRSCTGISRLYFTMRTCPPRFFESAQRSFDVALRSSLERIVTTSGPGFGDWQWRLAILPFAFGGLGVYSAGDMALWTSQREDHTSDWLRTIPISGLGQTMNACSACSRVFARDIYGDHVVLYAGIIGIKHRHNIVRDTLVDKCYRSGISAGKEVDIGLDGGRDKPLRPRGKYMDKCAAIGYGFLPFSFSSLGELEADAVILLKRIRKFSITQDIGARTSIHIFNRIGFTIAKGVGAQIVSRLPSNFLHDKLSILVADCFTQWLSAFLTQGTVSSISIVFSWGGSISPEGFMSSVLLWLVIIVMVVGVNVMVVVVIIVVVVVVVKSSSVVKLSFVIT